MKQHPEARQYRIAVKHDQIEIYEHVGPNYDTLLSKLQEMRGRPDPDLAERFREEEERYAHYTPVLRFILLDPKLRQFGVKRVYEQEGYTDGWLELSQTGPVAELARTLIPTLGTYRFFDLW